MLVINMNSRRHWTELVVEEVPKYEQLFVLIYITPYGMREEGGLGRKDN